MKSSIDPSQHRQVERRFIEHVEKLLDDDRLRVDTTRGRRPISSLTRKTTRTDKAVDLHRMMAEMGRSRLVANRKSRFVRMPTSRPSLLPSSVIGTPLMR